jgi:hypothetical protein
MPSDRNSNSGTSAMLSRCAQIYKITKLLGMSLYGKHESLSLADKPDDPAWRWFILNGPHGERFKWNRNTSLPEEKDIQFLDNFIEERAGSDSEFKSKIRDIALLVLERGNPILIRTAIQVLTIVGSDEDMSLIQQFVESDNIDIQNDAKCALFERGIKIIKKRSP